MDRGFCTLPMYGASRMLHIFTVFYCFSVILVSAHRGLYSRLLKIWLVQCEYLVLRFKSSE
jgi:hypothetical protein